MSLSLQPSLPLGHSQTCLCLISPRGLFPNILQRKCKGGPAVRDSECCWTHRWHYRCSQPTTDLKKGGVHCTAVPIGAALCTPVLGLSIPSRLGRAWWWGTWMSPEHAMLVKKARPWEIILLLALTPPLLITFSGGQEWNKTCCMTDSPSSSLGNLKPYFERPLKEKGLCAL